MKSNKLALVRRPSPKLINCELTHIQRETIDFPKLLKQHQNYVEMLKDLGCEVEYLPELGTYPDGVFVEDMALVLDEIAVIAHPGALSRRGEVGSVHERLGQLRSVVKCIQGPGTIDGGDILKVERDIYVALSTRTNQAGIDQLEALVAPYGYSVQAIPVTKCLHLKTGASYLGQQRLLINPEWVPRDAFSPQLTSIEIDPAEPFAANILFVNGKVLIAASALKTAQKLRAAGYKVIGVDISELARAEAGLTCLSIICS